MKKSVLFLKVIIFSLLTGTMATYADDSSPVFMQSEEGQVVIERANEFLKKESEFVKDPPADATPESLEELENNLYNLKNEAERIVSRLSDVYGFKSLNDPVTGIKGFKGRTANDLLAFFTKKVDDTQAKFERFQNARKEQEGSADRLRICRDNGFENLKAGEKIGVTEPDKLGIYWIATIVGPRSGSYLIKYDYRGKQAESVLANCDYLAKLDDKTKDIRKFKNAEEAGAAFGTAATAQSEANLDQQMCGSVGMQYIKKTGRCVKRK